MFHEFLECVNCSTYVYHSKMDNLILFMLICAVVLSRDLRSEPPKELKISLKWVSLWISIWWFYPQNFNPWIGNWLVSAIPNLTAAEKKIDITEQMKDFSKNVQEVCYWVPFMILNCPTFAMNSCWWGHEPFFCRHLRIRADEHLLWYTWKWCLDNLLLHYPSCVWHTEIWL